MVLMGNCMAVKPSKMAVWTSMTIAAQPHHEVMQQEATVGTMKLRAAEAEAPGTSVADICLREEAPQFLEVAREEVFLLLASCPPNPNG